MVEGQPPLAIYNIINTTAIYFENGKRVVTKEPLKVAKDCSDFTPSMKFEVYPNRDSTVFMDRFGMQDCETFIRGTFRFAGFSAIISAFHDIGITSDDPVDQGVSTLRDLAFPRFTVRPNQGFDDVQKAIVQNLTAGLP